MQPSEQDGSEIQIDCLLVVGDDALRRRGLVSLLEGLDGVEAADDLEPSEVSEHLRGVGADERIVIVWDTSEEGAEGSSLSTWSPRAQILIVSPIGRAEEAEHALRHGAFGYLLQDEVEERIGEAIQSLCAGKLYVCRDLIDEVLTRFVRGAVTEETGVDSLTDAERDVFRLVGTGLTAREIADRLHRSRKTIYAHRSRIVEKLGLDSVSELVRYATQWLSDETSADARVD